MSKLIFFPLSLLLLTACGHAEIDLELAPYWQEFVYQAQLRGVEITDSPDIIFVEKFEEPGRLGVCTWAGNIEISRAWWKTLGSSYREITIFHELGHCALGKGHSDSPDSIMYPYVGVQKGYEKNREFYLDELFNF